MVTRNIKDEIPHLITAGFDRKICIFVEIARHPNGLSVREIMDMFGENKATVWFQIRPLVENQLISSRRMNRNGRRQMIFKVTPYGIDNTVKEFCRLCELMSTIRKEVIKNGNKQ